MHQSSLLDVLFTRTRQAVLATLLLDPEKRWYRTQLANHLGVTPSSLQRELAALESVGILKKSSEGRRTYFQADLDCPVRPELQSLLIKTAGIKDLFREALDPLRKKIRIAFIYGSLARGEAVSRSDIDLFVIGTVQSLDLSSALRQAKAQLTQPVHYARYSEEEFVAKLKSKNHFLSAVIGEPKLFIIGDQNELEEIAR